MHRIAWYSLKCLEEVFLEVRLTRPSETRQHAFVINTAFGGCAALPHGAKLHPSHGEASPREASDVRTEKGEAGP
jgi:hypothetical protein